MFGTWRRYNTGFNARLLYGFSSRLSGYHLTLGYFVDITSMIPRWKLKFRESRAAGEGGLHVPCFFDALEPPGNLVPTVSIVVSQDVIKGDKRAGGIFSKFHIELNAVALFFFCAD